MQASTTFLRAVRFFAFAAVLSTSPNIPPALAADEAPAAEECSWFTPHRRLCALYRDAPRSQLLIEVPVFNQDVLYYVSAATNPGSVEAPFRSRCD